MIKKIVAQPHWREDIKCARQWLDGYEAAGGKASPIMQRILLQIHLAIDQDKS